MASGKSVPSLRVSLQCLTGVVRIGGGSNVTDKGKMNIVGDRKCIEIAEENKRKVLILISQIIPVTLPLPTRTVTKKGKINIVGAEHI